MNEMIERVAKAIQEATDKPRYSIKISKVWELWDHEKCIVSSGNHAHVDRLCDKLNNEYVARKVIEALKTISQDTYNNFKCDKLWRETNSAEVWDKWIDAILKE